MITKIDLVTGFLGAGKTTFLAHYGDWLDRQGIRFAVVENEFGAAGVDRAVLSRKFGNVSELSGGCICCTLKSGFYAMLAELSGKCDRILVEPSGVFDMDDFFEIVWTLERDKLCRMGMCLTLIDPHMLPDLKKEELGVLWTELTGTGTVVWTQTDVLPEPDLDAAAQEVNAILNLEIPLTFYPVSSHALTDKDFAVLQSRGPVRRPHHRRIVDHNRIFQSTSLRPKGIIDQGTLIKTMDSLMKDRSCGEILRIKGFVRSVSGSLAVNYTVSGRSVVPCTEMRSMLNFIGRKLDRAQIKSVIDAAMESIPNFS